MTFKLRLDSISGPAFRLVAGRVIGGVVSVAIPVALARTLMPAAFGTYKQLFLIYMTLYGVAQLGAAESLYYFVPKKPAEAARSIANSLATLTLVGAVCLTALYLTRDRVAIWMGNPAIASELPLLALFLTLTLISAAFEIVIVSRNEPAKAAMVYAASDITRTLSFVIPAILFHSLHAVLIGGVVYGAIRVTAMLGYFWSVFGRDLKLDGLLWWQQWAYALPFALAVGIDVVQANAHQWVVATRFDATAFAIYAVGCLQIPLVDLICTSTANVMMVKLAEVSARGEGSALKIWHDTTVKLASLMLPLAALLFLTAPAVIVVLFTKTYLASIPILRVWCLMVVPSAFAVDGVLRAHARTRFLLVMNVVRLIVIVGLVGWLISVFGIVGAVVATLVGTIVVKVMAIGQIASVMNVGVSEALPWKRLAITAVNAGVPLVPAWTVMDVVSAPIVLNAALSVTVYGAFYGALWYVLQGHVNASAGAAPAVAVTAPVAATTLQQET
jgi:O-antigen/teichoic acid export membrane protein